MHWLEKWRKEHQMSREMLAQQVGVSEQVIWMAENQNGFKTHPLIADSIADYTGATSAQRDSIVHEKHHGTYKPNPRAKRYGTGGAQQARPKVQKKLPERRIIVAVNRDCVELGRYPSLVAAAEAHEIGTMQSVADRCKRKLSPRANEFLPRGVTFRYADEWDAMPEWLRKDDMQRAEGMLRPHGRQNRKVI